MVEKSIILSDVPIDAVRLNPDNPRINEPAVARVETSIKQVGYISPIIVDDTMMILAGNTRYKALVKMGLKTIPDVKQVFGLTADEKKRYIIEDNKSHEFALWDFAKMAVYDEAMLKDIGFSDIELDKIRTAFNTVEDDIPPIKQEAIAKRGDIFQLGTHRIMCGDSLDERAVADLLGGAKVTLGFTSPPYWVGKSYEYQANVAEIEDFVRKSAACYNMAVDPDNSRIVINTGTGFTSSMAGKKKRQVLLLMDKWANAFFDLGWNLRHVRHWIKRGQLLAIASKNDIIDQHCEFIGTFENDAGKDMEFTDRLWESDVSLLETFYNVKGANRGHFKTGAKWALQGFWDDIRGNATSTGHIAAFPTELVVRHLFLYTRTGEKVLDLFLGSGTTIIACQKMARCGYGMELDPLYIDLCVRRFSQYAPNEKIQCLTREIDMRVYHGG